MTGVERISAEVQELMRTHDRYGLLSELARFVGVSRTTTGKWAAGDYPSETWQPRIAEFFGLPTDHFARVSDGDIEIGAAESSGPLGEPLLIDGRHPSELGIVRYAETLAAAVGL